MSTSKNKQKRRAYSSDISKNSWQQLKKLFPVTASSKGGRPATDLKEVINAIFYVVKIYLAMLSIMLKRRKEVLKWKQP